MSIAVDTTIRRQQKMLAFRKDGATAGPAPLKHENRKWACRASIHKLETSMLHELSYINVMYSEKKLEIAQVREELTLQLSGKHTC